MNIENISEQNFIWDIDGQKCSGLVSDRILRRKVTQINATYIQELAEILRKRTSLKNPDDGKQYYSVTDPLVNNLKYSGTWRNVLVETREDVRETGTIVQTLHYGWATTLIDTEARLVAGDNMPLQPERMIQRQYVALDFTKLGTMIDGIETTKYVDDPVIEGKTYTGRYRILSSKPDRAADGSGIITQTLAKNLVISAESLPTPILLTDDKALLSPFAHDTDSVKNAYIWEYRWIDPDYAQTLRDTISLVSGVIDARVAKVEDGSCSIQVLTQTNTWNGDLTQVWEQQQNFPDFHAERIVNTYSHISLANLSTYKTTLETATAGYKVSSLVDSTDAGQGFAQIIQTQDKLFVGTDDSATVSADNGIDIDEEYLQLLTDGVMLTTMWLGVADGDISTAMTTLETAPTGYVVLRVGHNYNGTGSCNIIRTMISKNLALDPIQMQVQFPEFDDERRTYYYFGLDKTTAESQYTTCKTTCDTGYKVDAVEITEWRGGALAVVQRISKLIADTTPTTLEALVALGHQIAIEYEWWGNGESTTTVFPNVPDADLDAVVTLLATAPSGYTVASISHNYNGSGKADVSRVLVKQNITGYETAIQFPTFLGERKTNIYLGLNSTDADTYYSTCQTPPSGYKVDSVTKQEGRRGTITVIQQLSKLNATPTSQVRAIDYTRLFGLANIATTVYLNISKDEIDDLKTTILSDTTKNIHSIQDNDNGQGMADVLVVWRSKEDSPRSLGAIRATKPTQFSQTSEDRVWIDVNLDSQTALSDAVTLALAGTAPYTISAGEEIKSVSGEDAGDKTAIIRQQIIKKPGSYTYADYSMQESFNPHGLREATMLISVREYPEVNYDDLATVFSDLQTFLGTPMKGRIQVSLAGNGSFMMRALKEGTPDWDNSTPTYVKTGVQYEDMPDESKEEVATGVPVASAAAIVDAATADADHALDSVSMQERGNGEAVITKRQKKKYETADLVIYEKPYAARRGAKTYVWESVLPANLSTVWTAATTEGVGVDPDDGYTYVLASKMKQNKGSTWRVTSHVVTDQLYWTNNSTLPADPDDSTYTQRTVEKFNKYGNEWVHRAIVAWNVAYFDNEDDAAKHIDTAQPASAGALPESYYRWHGFWNGVKHWQAVRVSKTYTTDLASSGTVIANWINSGT